MVPTADTCPPDFEEVAVKVQFPAMFCGEMLEEELLLPVPLPPPQPTKKTTAKRGINTVVLARSDFSGIRGTDSNMGDTLCLKVELLARKHEAEDFALRGQQACSFARLVQETNRWWLKNTRCARNPPTAICQSLRPRLLSSSEVYASQGAKPVCSNGGRLAL